MRTLYFPDFDLRLDADTGEVRARGATFTLSPLSLRLLLYLADSHDRVVSRSELLRVVWDGVQVTDGAVRQGLRTLRRELDRALSGVPVVRTVRGRGVQLAIAVREQSAGAQGVPLLGREPELALLLGALEKTRDGLGQLIVVSGPLGVGKTRLLEELSARAERRGFRSLRSTCAGVGEASLRPFEEVLATLVVSGQLALDALARTEAEFLAEAFPALAGPAGRQGRPQAAARERLFDAVLAALATAAAQRPLTLALDDIQAADRQTLGLVEWIAERAGRLPIGLLVAQRDGAAPADASFPALLGRLLRRPGVREIALAPLSRAAVEEAVAAALPGASAEEIATLWWRSEGNPHLLMLAIGQRRERPGSDPLPAATRATLLEPLRDLSPAASRLLRAASVAGERIRADLLAEVLEVDSAGLGDAIEEVRRAGLVRRDDDATLAFGPGLLVDSLADAEGALETARWHARWVAVLARHPGASQAELAEHAYRARPLVDDDEVARLCEQAAGEALRRGDLVDAGRLFERAATCTAEAGPERRLPIHLGLAEARARLGVAPDAIESAREAIALARAAGDDRAEARARRLAQGSDGLRDDTDP